MAELQYLRFEQVDASPLPIGLLTIHRPEVLNALCTDLVTELHELLVDLAGRSLGALVVTGAGDKAFVAGADIAEMSAFDVLQAEQFARLGQRTLSLLETFPAPTIAAVNGYALGGGTELAMACDLTLASPKAVFGQPEVKLGVIPGFGGTQRLVRRVGRQHAFELMTTGRNLDAQEAVRLGLALRVTGDDVVQDALDLARRILRNGPQAVRMVKRAVHETDHLDIDAGLSAEASLFAMCFATTDQDEGMAAFLGKRKPTFSGR